MLADPPPQAAATERARQFSLEEAVPRFEQVMAG